MPRLCLGRIDPFHDCTFGVSGRKAQVRHPYERCYFCDHQRLTEALQDSKTRNLVLRTFISLSDEHQQRALEVAPEEMRIGVQQHLELRQKCVGHEGQP
eukprot:6012581-Karenia_brevis.AAC.1